MNESGSSPFQSLVKLWRKMIEYNGRFTNRHPTTAVSGVKCALHSLTLRLRYHDFLRGPGLHSVRTRAQINVHHFGVRGVRRKAINKLNHSLTIQTSSPTTTPTHATWNTPRVHTNRNTRSRTSTAHSLSLTGKACVRGCGVHTQGCAGAHLKNGCMDRVI